jgi:hypothetical protein
VGVSSEYRSAAVCRRGHVASAAVCRRGHVASADVAEQRERWGRVKKFAPALWQTSQPFIETLATAAVRAATYVAD